jgi:predicted nucleic acid-binding Zn ribbon protein
MKKRSAKRKTGFPSSPNIGAIHVAEVLPQLIAKYGLQKQRNFEQITRIWRETVGEPYGSVTRVVGLKSRVLEIAVPHHAFVQELSFRQSELLAKLQTALAEEKIKRIKFVVAS